MRVVFILCAAIVRTACAGTGKNPSITAEELTLITGKLEEKAAETESATGLIMQTTVDAEADVEKREAVTSNVVMMLEGNSNRGEYVIIGAHYDHLGMGGPGSASSSLARRYLSKSCATATRSY